MICFVFFYTQKVIIYTQIFLFYTQKLLTCKHNTFVYTQNKLYKHKLYKNLTQDVSVQKLEVGMGYPLFQLLF